MLQEFSTKIYFSESNCLEVYAVLHYRKNTHRCTKITKALYLPAESKISACFRVRSVTYTFPLLSSQMFDGAYKSPSLVFFLPFPGRLMANLPCPYSRPRRCLSQAKNKRLLAELIIEPTSTDDSFTGDKELLSL